MYGLRKMFRDNSTSLMPKKNLWYPWPSFQQSWYKKQIIGIINIHTFKFTTFSLFNPCPLCMRRAEYYLQAQRGAERQLRAMQTDQGQRRIPFNGDPGLANREYECPGHRPSLHETVRSGHTHPLNFLHGVPSSHGATACEVMFSNSLMNPI
jgi:hypothetical protein